MRERDPWRILNLYAGIGGNRKRWTDCDVVAVEWDERIAAIYQRLHPDDTVVVGDAHQYLLDHGHEFDFIWSSPPCQSHSKMVKAGQNRTPRYPDLALYQEIVYLQHFAKVPWVVENVVPYYDILVPATKVGRHLFWSNFDFAADDVPRPTGFIDPKKVDKQDLMDWLGIHYEGNVYYDGNHCPAQVLRNAVHPDLGVQIYEAARGRHHVTADQRELFGAVDVRP
jgi:DNA (cytosine-5)-methyltransferase 1